MNLQTALKLAHACKASMSQLEDGRHDLKAINRNLPAFFDGDFVYSHDLSILNFEVLVITCKKYNIIVIRGTDECVDWAANLAFLPYKGVHSGYRAAATLLCRLVKEHLKVPFYLTGHSLGGAVATVLATDYYNNPRFLGSYAYGTPKVFDRALAESENRKLDRRYYRFRREYDVAPFLPPWLYHAGNSYTLKGDGTLSDRQPPFLRALLKDVRRIKEEHRIEHYINDLARILMKVNVK